MSKFVSSKFIYEAVELYDLDSPEYDCYMPCFSGCFAIVDCWICDKQGNIHPGYNICGVPVNVDNIGDPIGECE